MSLECDFAAWADRHDAAALGRVFDATAGRLLLLAVQVGGRGGEAEDLVQAAFLSAMEGAGSWDRQRPLWPWLVAILRNEARMEWRRRTRRREVEAGDATSEGEAGADPLRLLASQEALDAVLAAIEDLPLQYRQVLRLRLVHGLRNIEIARALELPVGTVRAQVHRGIQRLRAALSPSLAGLVGVWMAGQGSLMAQVRIRVLDHAAGIRALARGAAGVGATTSPFLIGGLMTIQSKSFGWLAAGLALVLLLGGGLALGGVFAADSTETQPRDLSVRSGDSTVGQPGEVVRRAPVREPAAAVAPVWPMLVTVRSPSGVAIPDAEVRVWTDTRFAARLGSKHLSELASGHTAEDGTFRCGLDAARERSPLERCCRILRISARKGARYAGTFKVLPRETTARSFTVELALAPATRVTGRVLDPGGRSVGDARILLRPSEVGSLELRTERSDADGRFELSLPSQGIAAGPSAALVIAHPGHGTTSRGLAETAAAGSGDAGMDLGDIVLRRRGRIRGRVTLGDGLGLAGFPVIVRELDRGQAAAARRDPKVLTTGRHLGPTPKALRWQQGSPCYSFAETSTSADGSFSCAGLDPRREFAVYVRDARMQHIAVLARPDEQPVRLEVDRQLITLQVLQAAAGAQLPGAQVVARGFGLDPSVTASPDGPPRLRVVARFFPRDEAGRRLLLSPFGWRWQMTCSEPLAVWDPLQHEVRAGIHRVALDLRVEEEKRFGELRLVVVDEAGEPWPEFGFELKALDRELTRSHRRMVPQSSGECLVRDLPAGRWQLTTYLGREVVMFPLPLRMRGQRSQELRVAAGATTEVRVVSRPAGIVCLDLWASPPPAGGVWQKLRISRGHGGAQLSGLAFDPTSPRQDPYTPRVGLRLVCADALPPGEQTLVVEAEGYRPTELRVDVKADRQVTARVELIPL